MLKQAMTDKTWIFLKKSTPFNLLKEADWEAVESSLYLSRHSADQVICQQGISTLEALSVIYEGSVEKYFERPNGQKAYQESFHAGESFGAVSMLLNNEKAFRSVRTLSPTQLINIPKESFLELCKREKDFNEFFIQHFGKRMLEAGYANLMLEKPRKGSTFQVSDLAFQQQLHSFYTQTINSCPTSTSIRDAAKQMTTNRRSYILVRSENGYYEGIITDQILRSKAIAEGIGMDEPVTAIMRGPIYTIDSEEFVFEAILKMFRRKINYLLVKRSGKVVGIVGLGRLLNAQGKSPFLFIQSIRSSYDTKILQDKWREVPEMVDSLIERGTRPEIVNQIVSSISDAITQNIIGKAIRKLGPPPSRFVFIALGSEGRREQSLKTDQDNAIIFEDVPEEEQEQTQTYFLQLGKLISDELNTVGFSYCQGKLMASNPAWNQSLSVWKKYYLDWISQPMGERALIASVFFDAKAIYGHFPLMKELLSYVQGVLEERGSSFLAQLARHSLVNRPPLGWFGMLQETTSEDRKGINIKRAMQTITDYARIYSLREQLRLTNTGERLKGLIPSAVLSEAEFTELHQAYYFMMRLRLTHQTRLIMEGNSPDNMIPLASLSKIEQVTLREIFKVIEKYQKRLSTVYLGF